MSCCVSVIARGRYVYRESGVKRRGDNSSSGSLRLLAHSSLIAVFFTVLIAFIFFVSHVRVSQYFPITTVRVYGLDRISQKNVETLLRPLVSHGFFGINVDFIRDRLMLEPWAADVFVRRNWPDQIEVTVVEKKPVARWSGGTLLSDGGVLFTPRASDVVSQLPTFVGPAGKHVLMLNYFNEMNRLLQPLHAKISYLELTPYLTWKLKLNNGIAMQIGHKDILTRLGHFVKVYPKIVGDSVGNVESIDLRYSNGVAVRWKTPVKI